MCVVDTWPSEIIAGKLYIAKKVNEEFVWVFTEIGNGDSNGFPHIHKPFIKLSELMK